MRPAVSVVLFIVAVVLLTAAVSRDSARASSESYPNAISCVQGGPSTAGLICCGQPGINGPTMACRSIQEIPR